MSIVPLDVERCDITSLLEMLEEIPDPRRSRGKIYSLSFLLAVILVATLTGAKCPRELHRRAADLPQPLLARLGAPLDHFRGSWRTPSEKTIRLLLKKIDVDALDAAFGGWLYAQAARGQVALAIDGKVLRGAWSGEDTQVRLLSAMLQGQGVVIAQVRVPDDTNEITVVEELVGKLPKIPGTPAVTLDAVHAQHATAELLVKAGLDYILTIKGNQPTLQRKIFELVLPLLQEAPNHEIEERGHGRIKNWMTWTTKADEIDFPHAATAGVIRRDEFDLTGTRISREHALILTSVSPKNATAEYLHTHIRGHWGIENEIHYTRDTAWREDANPTYTGNTNHSLASFRNLAIGVIRLNGTRKIKETLEHVAADRYRALPLLATVCNRSTR
ncbi:ISAs1 family transposase [Pseudofrankia sp. DC12]|uniref:ISAs1 family transposase n=1 Tax=Pseudofrankia sp. DC12 TaxID=683315 RepID=UPI0005F87388|nr:ISAs1 family transposase [Pseudofrankia sp. DC12]